MTEDAAEPYLGRRIVVRGATGSGKTTLTRRLGALLDLPAIELDALFWQPSWAETPAPEFREKVTEALEAVPEGWVCDGAYTTRLGDLVVSRANTLVWLHLPWRVSFWRLLKRTIGRARTREPMWAGNTESWRKAFLSRDSLLLWSITHHRGFARSTRRSATALPEGSRVYELKSAREVEALLSAVERSATAGFAS